MLLKQRHRPTFAPHSLSSLRAMAGRPTSVHLRRTSAGRPGFVFLISVLVIGIIVTEMAMSLILLGLAAQQSGFTVAQTAQAFENAQTCAERGLRSLRADLSYDGNETFTLVNGTCSITRTGGSGNQDRALCVQGESGRSTRRIEIAIQEVYPSIKILSWSEVGSFTLCP